MEIAIAEKGAFYFEPRITTQEARGRASAHKTSAFGTLSRLFSRPKEEDIALSDQGLWYLPLWHAKAHLHFVYDRSESYKLPITTHHASTVTLGGNEYPVSGGAIDLPVIEHCEREEQREVWLDGLSGQPINSQPYLKAAAIPVDLDGFAPEGAKIVAPAFRASAVVRTLLGEDFRPTDADDMKQEEVNVECIDLYLRPTFNFTCNWAAKNKLADLAVDALTGELQSQPPVAVAAVAKLLKPETLFDLGAETLNVVVPGGAIALKVVKALAHKQKT
ncbi:MAG: hypothetical protein JOZ77_08590 [Candidatus Eremiobacteraeota bacterium]|nr:hypothetical protein [Candidatus Eremiobacteraeota bacterium]